jgi:hypothetical protein
MVEGGHCHHGAPLLGGERVPLFPVDFTGAGTAAKGWGGADDGSGLGVVVGDAVPSTHPCTYAITLISTLIPRSSAPTVVRVG